jgi:pilus assembly protein FimV
MRKEFEALTVKLNRNFNVEILAWDNETSSGELELVPLAGAAAKAHTLEDIPRLRDEIVALWGKPECLGYLENLLRDNRQGKRKGFPLAVAEEILFLIDLAAAHESAR